MIQLPDTPADAAFRRELRAWLDAHLPPAWRAAGARLPDDEAARVAFLRRWQRTLYEGGWLVVHWPRAYGGRGATPRQQMIYTEELARAEAPKILDNVAVGIVGPTLIAFGTEAQKRRYLQPALAAEELWCLGFSEPNAGSDLASLRTEAHRDGAEWVITGQKVWSSRAHIADWCLLLARSDPKVPKHRGLTCLLVPMDARGITVRPLRQLTGQAEFSEVFFDEVRIPLEAVLGGEGRGWTVVRTALAHERGTLWVSEFKIRLEKACRALAALYRAERERLPAPVARSLRSRVAQAYIESACFAANTLRVLPQLHGAKEAPPEAALQKLFGSELEQRIEELALELLGPAAALYHDPAQRPGPDWQELFLYGRSVTISSGTSEIMRNLLAERALGLPRGA